VQGSHFAKTHSTGRNNRCRSLFESSAQLGSDTPKSYRRLDHGVEGPPPAQKSEAFRIFFRYRGQLLVIISRLLAWRWGRHDETFLNS
jgi:hypothetical protein